MIEIKWVFRKKKKDENRNALRNKVILVAKGYNQQKDIDFNESYAHVGRLYAIMILLAFSCIFQTLPNGCKKHVVER